MALGRHLFKPQHIENSVLIILAHREYPIILNSIIMTKDMVLTECDQGRTGACLLPAHMGEIMVESTPESYMK
jgi:hypothetical protein